MSEQIDNPQTSEQNVDQQKPVKNQEDTTTTLLGRAFINTITKRDGKGENASPVYFAQIALSCGKHQDGNWKKQYLELFVDGSLNRLMENIHQTQTFDENKRASHRLSGIPCLVEIHNPYFTTWTSANGFTGLNSTGVLKKVSF